MNLQNNKKTRYAVHNPRIFKALVAKDLLPIDMGTSSKTGNPYWVFKNTTYLGKCLTEINA